MCNPISTAYPERLLAQGFHRGLEWEVVYNHYGYRCGYVRIPAGHPWHGLDTEQLNRMATVHGGVTFAEPDEQCGKEGPDDAWWIGFDTAHAFDAPDPVLMEELKLPASVREIFGGLAERAGRRSSMWDSVVRSTTYVTRECQMLAEQVEAAR